jgi:hypothetical protein
MPGNNEYCDVTLPWARDQYWFGDEFLWDPEDIPWLEEHGLLPFRGDARRVLQLQQELLDEQELLEELLPADAGEVDHHNDFDPLVFAEIVQRARQWQLANQPDYWQDAMDAIGEESALLCSPMHPAALGLRWNGSNWEPPASIQDEIARLRFSLYSDAEQFTLLDSPLHPRELGLSWNGWTDTWEPDPDAQFWIGEGAFQSADLNVDDSSSVHSNSSMGSSEWTLFRFWSSRPNLREAILLLFLSVAVFFSGFLVRDRFIKLPAKEVKGPSKIFENVQLLVQVSELWQSNPVLAFLAASGLFLILSGALRTLWTIIQIVCSFFRFMKEMREKLRAWWRLRLPVRLSNVSFGSEEVIYERPGIEIIESMMPNSSIFKAKPGRYAVEILVQIGGKYSYVGGSFIVRARNGKHYLVGPYHVLSVSKELVLRKPSFETKSEVVREFQVDPEKFIELDPDLVAYPIAENYCSVLGYSPIQRQIIHRSHCDFVSINAPKSGDEWHGSCGKLKSSQVAGMVEYSGSTLPGFSGCLYMSGGEKGQPLGMHIGASGKVNHGYSINYIMCCLDVALKLQGEATADYLVELSYRHRKPLKAKSWGVREKMVEKPDGTWIQLSDEDISDELWALLDFGDGKSFDSAFVRESVQPGKIQFYQDLPPENQGFPVGAPQRAPLEEEKPSTSTLTAPPLPKKRKKRSKKSKDSSVLVMADQSTTSTKSTM